MPFNVRKDITGKKFGKLTALEFVAYRSGASYWLCRCDCGNTVETRQPSLVKGYRTHCGCSPKKVPYTKRCNAVLIDTPNGPMIAAQAARYYKVPASRLYYRAKHGWPAGALFIPPDSTIALSARDLQKYKN